MKVLLSSGIVVLLWGAILTGQAQLIPHGQEQEHDYLSPSTDHRDLYFLPKYNARVSSLELYDANLDSNWTR